MNNISFKAETIKGEIIEACCVINKHDRLLLSNEAKAGFWIECKPDTLQVINKNQEMKVITDLNEIDRTTKEGRLLFAALAKITTESQTDKTPYEVLEQLEDLATKMDE